MAHPDARDAHPLRRGGWVVAAVGVSGRSVLRPDGAPTVFVGLWVAGWGAGCGGRDIALVPANSGQNLLDRHTGELATLIAAMARSSPMLNRRWT